MGQQYEEYIEQSNHCTRWKVLAYNWLIKCCQAECWKDYVTYLEYKIEKLLKIIELDQSYTQNIE